MGNMREMNVCKQEKLIQTKGWLSWVDFMKIHARAFEHMYKHTNSPEIQFCYACMYVCEGCIQHRFSHCFGVPFYLRVFGCAHTLHLTCVGCWVGEVWVGGLVVRCMSSRMCVYVRVPRDFHARHQMWDMHYYSADFPHVSHQVYGRQEPVLLSS